MLKLGEGDCHAIRLGREHACVKKMCTCVRVTQFFSIGSQQLPCQSIKTTCAAQSEKACRQISASTPQIAQTAPPTE
eukprot:6041192-Amphidinium_carterae.2